MTVKITSPDWGRVGHALGVVEGIARTLDTDVYIEDLVGRAANYAAMDIGETIDEQARVDHTLSHVYEWRLPGNPAGRLFAIYPVGRGRNRIVTFNFLASKTPVPSIEEREQSGAILPLPSEVKAKLDKSNSNRYVFRQKAEMMEYGMSVHITPRNGEKLFIPLDYQLSNGKTYVFANQANVSFANSAHAGRFTAAYAMAQIEAGSKAIAYVDNIVETKTKETSLRMGRTATKTLNLGFAEGQNYARNRMNLKGVTE